MRQVNSHDGVNKILLQLPFEVVLSLLRFYASRILNSYRILSQSEALKGTSTIVLLAWPQSVKQLSRFLLQESSLSVMGKQRRARHTTELLLPGALTTSRRGRGIKYHARVLFACRSRLSPCVFPLPIGCTTRLRLLTHY